MIKKMTLCFLAMMALSATTFAQGIFVNREFQVTSGSPFFNPIVNQFGGQWSKSIVCSTGGLITVGYTSIPGNGQDIYLVKRDHNGLILFESTFNTASSYNDYGIGLSEAGNGDILVCGTTDNGGSVNYDIVVLRFDSHGVLLYSDVKDGPAGKNDIAVSIVENSAGKVLVAANTEGTAGFSDFWLLKYSSALVFSADNTYDYAGLNDFVIGMQFDIMGNVNLVGPSASGLTTCDYVFAVFNESNLAYISEDRSSVSGTALDQPLAFCKDVNNNTYITGKAWNGSNFDLKTLKITSGFSIAWTATLDVHGLDDVAGTIVADPVSGDVIIGGYATRSNNIKEMICIRYNASNGSVINALNQSSEDDSGDAFINQVAVNANGDVYFTGEEKGNSGNRQVVTGKIKASGMPAWQKKITKSFGVLTSDLEVASDGIYVISVLDSVVKAYQTTKYSEFEVDTNMVLDGNGAPAWKQNELIVRFLPAALNTSAIDNPNNVYDNLSGFMDVTAYAQLNTALAGFCRDCDIKAIKVFPELPSTYTATTSRLGETIPLPDFWTTLLLVFPPGITIQQAHTVFNGLEDIIAYSHPNFIARPAAASNDSLYANQASLHPTVTYTNGGINVEEAWSVIPGGGAPFVRGGVFDTGVNWEHKDFGYNGVSSSTSKIDGWDLIYNMPVKSMTGGGDQFNHGTACAGIIGAIRNNSIGIAGIAGGNDSAALGFTTKGVSIYSLRMMDGNGVPPASPLNFLADAIVTSSIKDSSLNYAYGLHFMNHSWYISPFNGSAIFYTDTNITLLSEAVHQANRAKVTFIACRGNLGLNGPELPATIDDDWVLSVGGTGTDGQFAHSDNALVSNAVNAEFTPCYGRDLDVAAPATTSLIITTNNSNAGYKLFNGTSAAAPHVSGVVGLLMSYMNNPSGNDDPDNLAPEDGEAIIQLSATDTDTTGYDVLTGYGRLNAGKALRLVEKPFNTLWHFASDGAIPYTINKTLYSNYDTITITERYKNKAMPRAWFKKGKYVVKTYQIDATVYHNIPSTDTIQAAWPRPSSPSEVLELTNAVTKKLRPRERVKAISVTNNLATLKGYVYEVKDTLGTPLGWWPCDTTFSSPNIGPLFAYSVLTRDHSKVVGIQEKKAPATDVTLFPNPAGSGQTLLVESDKAGPLSVYLYDLMGRLIKVVYSGKQEAGKTTIYNDVSGLANSMYIYIIKSGDTVVNKRFIKQ